ncbi:response regulator [Roseomonas sp. NAR14]|uniref:Response regulator n=1 Tax=Roseomonas acroporae TaxID=2937791 RepID=A0A9X1Y463_9PROT|nr:response regulator [Roseomonas acroporae]MCK8782827.1 response regulator [Roseomonas acroporae]
MHVLLVEDEALLRETVAGSLIDAGMDVVAAATAEEALAVMANDGPPPVVVTDIDLGAGMDGLTFACKLRSLEPDVRLLLMTGRPQRLAGRPVLAMAERHLFKPFPVSDLVAAVSEMLRDGMAAQAN